MISNPMLSFISIFLYLAPNILLNKVSLPKIISPMLLLNPDQLTGPTASDLSF